MTTTFNLPQTRPETQPEWQLFLNQLQAFQKSLQPQPPVTLTYGTSIGIDASLGRTFIVTATNGTGFTITAPTNAIKGQEVRVIVRNASGGSLGTLTWGAGYKLASWTQPANSNARAITYVYDGTNFVEVSRTPADVPT